MKSVILPCKCCGKPLKGRSDKKFCAASCKNAFYYDQRNNTVFRETEQILRLNHKILLQILGNTNEKVIEEIVLDTLHFNRGYLTRIFRNSKGEEFFVLYDCAWSKTSDGKIKIIKK